MKAQPDGTTETNKWINSFDAPPRASGIRRQEPICWRPAKTTCESAWVFGLLHRAARTGIARRTLSDPMRFLRLPARSPPVAPLNTGWYRQRIRCGCVAACLTLTALVPVGTLAAAPKFASPATMRVDTGATVALPRTWGAPRLTQDSPIPSMTSSISSPFGPSRLVFAQQAAPSEGFGLVTVRKSEFDKGTPRYLETLRPRDLAILLNHMESRVHGDRPTWADRLVRGKPPVERLLGERRVIYWEGEWRAFNGLTTVVRGYGFFGNGAVYLLRVFGTAGRGQPDFAEETRFADAVATTFRTK